MVSKAPPLRDSPIASLTVAVHSMDCPDAKGPARTPLVSETGLPSMNQLYSMRRFSPSGSIALTRQVTSDSAEVGDAGEIEMLSMLGGLF